MDGTGGEYGDGRRKRRKGAHGEVRQQTQSPQICKHVREGTHCPWINRCYFRHPEIESGMSMNDTSQRNGSGSGAAPAGNGAAGGGRNDQGGGSTVGSRGPGLTGNSRSTGGRVGAAAQGGRGAAARPGTAQQGNHGRGLCRSAGPTGVDGQTKGTAGDKTDLARRTVTPVGGAGPCNMRRSRGLKLYHCTQVCHQNSTHRSQSERNLLHSVPTYQPMGRAE